ncbi:MAG: MBL fold metallo-hydrolase [Acidobacteria bacterium]|nr:MBL fold metallo-hydrolase [Acidobacteriota bacterium]
MSRDGTPELFVHTEVVAPFEENARVIGDRETGEGVLVDPGGQVDALLHAAGNAGIDVQAIWLTHAHLDHVTGVNAAVELLGDVPILLHPDDAQLYEAVVQQGMMFGFPVDAPAPVTDWLSTGQDLALGRRSARVLHLPGHAPGHVGFWFSGQRTLLSGDVLFSGSIGRTDLPGGDYATLMQSITAQVLPLGDDVRVLSGHGPDTTVGRERVSNPFLQGR